MTTSFQHLPLDRIRPHQKNVRHAAAADQELIDSVKTHGLLQALVAVPATDGTDMVDLIAGHRRLDALTKAGATTAPVIIRDDLVTEAQQIEAMLVENGRREDLSPIEEAEGYEQLELFGYKPKDIAQATGRAETTVRARLKLRQLSTETRGKVHDGQVSIHDALALTQFADKPAVLAKLEAAAGTSNFAYTLQRAKDEQARHDADMKLRSQIAMRGIPEAPLDQKGGAYWHRIEGPYPIAWMHDCPTEAEHKDCLAWTDYDGRVQLVCSDPKSHRAEVSSTPVDPAVEKRRAEERSAFERQQEANKAQREAEEAAAKVRLGHAVQVLEQAKLPDVLLDLVQYLLPAHLVKLNGIDYVPDSIAQALGYEAAPQRYTSINELATMVVDAPTWSRAKVVHALAALLTSAGEDTFHVLEESEQDAQAAHLYLTWLADSDYLFSDVDNELRDKVEAALTEDEDEEVAS